MVSPGSDGAQVPVEVDVADDVVESTRFVAPMQCVKSAKFLAQVVRQDLAAGELVDRRVPAVGDLAFQRDDFAFLDHTTRVAFVFQAVMHAGCDRGGHQVGIRVGAGGAMLEPQILLVRDGASWPAITIGRLLRNIVWSKIDQATTTLVC